MCKEKDTYSVVSFCKKGTYSVELKQKLNWLYQFSFTCIFTFYFLGEDPGLPFSTWSMAMTLNLACWPFFWIFFFFLGNKQWCRGSVDFEVLEVTTCDSVCSDLAAEAVEGLPDAWLHDSVCAEVPGTSLVLAATSLACLSSSSFCFSNLLWFSNLFSASLCFVSIFLGFLDHSFLSPGICFISGLLYLGQYPLLGLLNQFWPGLIPKQARDLNLWCRFFPWHVRTVKTKWWFSGSVLMVGTAVGANNIEFLNSNTSCDTVKMEFVVATDAFNPGSPVLIKIKEHTTVWEFQILKLKNNTRFCRNETNCTVPFVVISLYWKVYVTIRVTRGVLAIYLQWGVMYMMLNIKYWWNSLIDTLIYTQNSMWGRGM